MWGKVAWKQQDSDLVIGSTKTQAIFFLPTKNINKVISEIETFWLQLYCDTATLICK